MCEKRCIQLPSVERWDTSISSFPEYKITEMAWFEAFVANSVKKAIDLIEISMIYRYMASSPSSHSLNAYVVQSAVNSMASCLCTQIIRQVRTWILAVRTI